MMKSKNSYFKTWFSELVRKYWILYIIGFMAYFISVSLPIYMNITTYDRIYEYAQNTMYNCNPIVITIDIFFAIITSISVFSFLHNKNASILIHSMPIGRKKLFWYSTFSGFVFMIIPIILIGISLLPLSQAQLRQMPSNGYDDFTAPGNLFTLWNISKWIFIQFVNILFVYAISVFSAVISGNSIIHFLLSMFFFILPTALNNQISLIMNTFCFGFKEFKLIPDEKLSPFMTGFMSNEFKGHDIYIHLAIFILISAVILVLSYNLYKIVKAERGKSACVFPVLTDIICVILTFVLTLLPAIGIHAFTNSNSIFTLNSRITFFFIFICISLLFFIICRMIATSSTSVFNFDTIKRFVIYIPIVTLVFVFTVFNIQNIEGKVPEALDIKYISIEDDWFTDFKQDINLSNLSSIVAVRNLHNEILKEYNSGGKNVNTDDIPNVSITYKLKNGKTIRRDYYVEINNSSNKNLKKLFGKVIFSEELVQDRIKKFENLALKAEELNLDTKEGVTIIKKKDRRELIRLYSKSLSKRNINDLEKLQNDSFSNFSSINIENHGSYPIFNTDKYVKKFLETHEYL